MCRMPLLCIGIALVVLAGCGHMPNRATAQFTPASLNHFYDYQLVRSADQNPIDFSELIQELSASDVIFVGELHSHSASHYLQMQVLTGLYQRDPQLILSMEQFERDKQTVVDDYLDDKIGEQTLMAQGKAWPNYASDYRPLVEFAKAHHLPIIAANAPKALVRCIAQKGPDVIDRLPSQQRAFLAADLTRSSVAYQSKFREFMAGAGAVHGHAQPKSKPDGSHGEKTAKAPTPHGAHGEKTAKAPTPHGAHGEKTAKAPTPHGAHGEKTAKAPTPHGAHGHGHGAKNGKLSNSFYAQLARDNTMAESIAKALDAHPNHRVVAINGAFHSDGRLGTVDALKRLKPNVNIVVLSPYERTDDASVLSEAAKQGDYIYAIHTMPKRYVQKAHRDRAVMDMIKKRKVRQCAW